jgi:hypothetical protein
MAAIVGVVALTAGIVMNWNQIVAGMVGGFQILFGGILGLLEGFVNSFIDGINKAIDAVNDLGANIGHVANVNFGANAMVRTGIETQQGAGMHGGTNYAGPGTSNSQRGGFTAMAAGGIVTSPVNALIGEAGPEAIIPLDRLGKMGGNSYNITVQAGVGDPQVIGQQIVAYIKRYEKASGPVFAGA